MFCLSDCVQTEEESRGKVFRIHCEGLCLMSTGQHPITKGALWSCWVQLKATNLY